MVVRENGFSNFGRETTIVTSHQFRESNASRSLVAAHIIKPCVGTLKVPYHVVVGRVEPEKVSILGAFRGNKPVPQFDPHEFVGRTIGNQTRVGIIPSIPLGQNSLKVF